MDDTIEPSLPATEVAVIGSGLAGLSAAAVIAKAGKSVTVLERSRHTGGRAATNVHDEIHFNLGPRALYCGGHAFRGLKELGVSFHGGIPSFGRPLMTYRDRAHGLPFGLKSILMSRFFTLAEKWRLLRFLGALANIEPNSWNKVVLAEWLQKTLGQGRLADFVGMLVRLSTYAQDPEQLSAGAAIEQFQIGRQGVWYLDGGWQTLVDGLAEIVAKHGGCVRIESSIQSIREQNDKVSLLLGNGSRIVANAVILAVDPSTAIKLLDPPESSPLRRGLASTRPAMASCLDVALSRLPRPGDRFALGIDQSLYYSVHTGAARLAPAGTHVVHVMKYLGPEKLAADDVERRLESFLDRLQPGWRHAVVSRRYLPNMVVTHGIPLASQGGTAGRPSVAIPNHPRVFLAGDWIGATGQLGDAAFASGVEAARLSLAVTSDSSQRSFMHAGA